VDYTYHNQLTLNSVLGNFPESYSLDTAYDPAGRIVRRRLGTPGTIVTQYSYNPWNTQGGRMARLSTTDDARLLQDLRYAYDAMGNVLTLQDYWNNNGGPQTQSFTYDALDRLTSAQAIGGLFGNFNLESYTYNAASGNLESKAGVSYTYGDANHAHAATGLIWGSLTARLEAAGQPRLVMETLIAASALRHNLIVATRNVADFMPTGTQVINPWE
jgi:hypothetical protein